MSGGKSPWPLLKRKVPRSRDEESNTVYKPEDHSGASNETGPLLSQSVMPHSGKA